MSSAGGCSVSVTVRNYQGSSSPEGGGDQVEDEYTPSYAVRMKLELEAFLVVFVQAELCSLAI